MANIRLCSSIFKILLFSLSILADISVSSFVSGDISESHSLVGRSLLQAKKACPVDFEFQNYTIITSQCKGPEYPTGPCCKSFKEFACPFSDELNDLSNICAETMFSYINRKGNYTGVFSNKCVEGKDGLDCSAFSPPQPVENTSGVGTTDNRYQLIMFTTLCVVPLLSVL
ncbi:GPI-anchored protein LLG1-like [Apium graveolens]|uniref:GPI-anchored protein LLG1-like n=1 Tax=Apium graveolens TaxID=4045 RepID=UPI003D78DAE4